MIKRLMWSAMTLPLLTCCTSALKHPDMRIQCALAPEDVAHELHGRGGEVELFDGQSSGRFPTGLAVVRLRKERGSDGAARLKLLPFRPFELPYWAELFDGTPQIRSVFEVHEKSVRDDYVTIAELWRAAGIMNAGLLLVVGYDNVSTPEQCDVFGLLYEIPDGRLVASIRHRGSRSDAWVASAELGERVPPESEEDWAYFTDHVAFRAFERKVKETLWLLIDRDEQSEQLKPNPYAGAKPVYPQLWLNEGR